MILMESLIKDIQYGFRNLLKRPSYTAIALITLAFGIGANTAIFSLVSTVLLRPLPVPHPEQLVEVYGTFHQGADYTIQSYLNYKDYRDRNNVFSGLMAYRFAPMSISHENRNERVWGISGFREITLTRWASSHFSDAIFFLKKIRHRVLIRLQLSLMRVGRNALLRRMT